MKQQSKHQNTQASRYRGIEFCPVAAAICALTLS